MREDGGDELARDIRETVRDLINSISVQNGQSTADSKYIFIMLGVLALVVLVILAVTVLHIFADSRERKIQRLQFSAILNLVKGLSDDGEDEADGENAQNVQNADNGENAPANPRPKGQSELDELKGLISQCEALGERIDRHTDRRGNSKAVSELVFKISEALGLDKKLCTLNFCAAMVYDSGFLDLPEELFFSEILSASERKLMRTHVMRYDGFLDFIPHRYHQFFSEAASLHHENMNGSGYPEGLGGKNIPQLPRILHAVESYVSLVKRRSYHKILSKKDAIAELRRQPGIYDAEIIGILETLV